MTKYELKIGHNVKFMGDFVVANTIENSFNKVSSSAASEQIKEKLKEITEAVADMCNHLPEDEARAAARDLDSLTKEVISSKPRRKWYQINAEGLIEAAKTVGELGAPVITAVSSLLALI